MKLMGNHIFASRASKSRKEMRRIRFAAETQSTETVDCMQSRRKVILNDRPDTTNCATMIERPGERYNIVGVRTLFTTVMRIEARQ